MHGRETKQVASGQLPVASGSTRLLDVSGSRLSNRASDDAGQRLSSGAGPALFARELSLASALTPGINVIDYDAAGAVICSESYFLQEPIEARWGAGIQTASVPSTFSTTEHQPPTTNSTGKDAVAARENGLTHGRTRAAFSNLAGRFCFLPAGRLSATVASLFYALLFPAFELREFFTTLPVGQPSPQSGGEGKATRKEDPMSVWQKILLSRKCWIAFAAVVSCVCVSYGVEESKVTPLITAIVTLAGVVIAAIGVEDGAEKFGLGQGDADLHDKVKTIMAKNSSEVPKILLLLLIPALLFTGVGCTADAVSVQADQARHDVVAPVVMDYAARHPSQAQSWFDFLRSWQRSIDARASQSAMGSGQSAVKKPIPPG